MLAADAEVNVETIRYYHRRGLLRQPRRPAGGPRSGASVRSCWDIQTLSSDGDKAFNTPRHHTKPRARLAP